MKSKLSIFLLCVLSATLLLIGCSSKPDEDNVSADTQTNVSINFLADTSLTWNTLNPLIEEFTKETGINVNTLILEESNLWAKTALEVSAPATDFNIIMGHTKEIIPFLKAGYLEPLDGYLEGIATYNRADFIEDYLQACSYEGQLYGLPMYSTSFMMAYRADLFAKYDIPPIETWDDLAKVCEILAQGESDISPFAVKSQRPEPFTSILYRSMGGEWIDSQEHSAVDVEILQKAIEYYTDIMKSYAPVGFANYNYAEVQNEFAQGKLAIMMDEADTLALLEKPEESRVAGEIGYSVIPRGVRHIAPGYSWALIIPKNTQHKSEAARFLGWLMSPEIASQINLTQPKQTWDVSALVPAYSDYQYSISLRDCMEATGEITDLDYSPRDEKFAQMKSFINTSVHEVLTDSKTPFESANEIAEECLRLYPA